MRFVVHNLDKADSLHIRQANRDAHLAHLKSDSDIRVEVAGPLLDHDGEMCGSLLIVSAANRTDLDAWLANDPYVVAGLTAQSSVHAYNWVLGKPD